MIEVYLDESGTHHDSQVLAVASVWATKEDWQAWTIDWIVAKAPISVYHSVDSHNRTGEFKEWSKAKRNAFNENNIFPTIRNHYIRGIISAIDKRELSKVLWNRHYIKILEEDLVRGWYYICLQWALRSTWEALDRNGNDNIAFVHENNQYVEAALSAFEQVEKRFPNKSATFSFGTKLAYPPLQCADILAYEGNHQMRDFQKPLRKPLRAIDPTYTRFSFRKYDASEVELIADFMTDWIKRHNLELP